MCWALGSGDLPGAPGGRPRVAPSPGLAPSRQVPGVALSADGALHGVSPRRRRGPWQMTPRATARTLLPEPAPSPPPPDWCPPPLPPPGVWAPQCSPVATVRGWGVTAGSVWVGRSPRHQVTPWAPSPQSEVAPGAREAPERPPCQATPLPLERGIAEPRGDQRGAGATAWPSGGKAWRGWPLPPRDPGLSLRTGRSRPSRRPQRTVPSLSSETPIPCKHGELNTPA